MPQGRGKATRGAQAGSGVRSYLTCLPLHPPQAAVAQCFQREQLHFGQPSSYFVQFPLSLRTNREHMIRSLQSVGLKPIVPQGSYFLITDISNFSAWDWPGWTGLKEAGGYPGFSMASVPQKARCLTCLGLWTNPMTDASSSG